jgi:YD repeat-containing protein
LPDQFSIFSRRFHENSIVARSYMFYAGRLSTARDADGKRKTSTRDYLGRITEVKEFSDANTAITTTYKYNAVGDLKTITNGANITEIQYDSLGRKISMTDPDMGRWMYCYDASGNMLRQLDPKRQMTVFTYDELNRVKSKGYYTVPLGTAVGVGTPSLSSDLKSVADSDDVTYAAFSNYNAAGSPDLISYGNGVKTKYNYQAATFNLA